MDFLSQDKKHIVVVDDNPVNLALAESVLSEYYKVTRLISGEQLFKFLARVTPDLVLLDIRMPEMDGFEVIRLMKENPAQRQIPVIFLTSLRDSISEREGFRLGALDFITKPFDNKVMLSRVHIQLELQQYRTDLERIVDSKTSRIEELQGIITIGCAEMIESRDGTTGSHVRNTTRFFETMLHVLEQDHICRPALPAGDFSELLHASTMHDIGKIGISDAILKKPGPLTPEEFEEMKRHSRIGADMIQKMIDQTHEDDFLYRAREMALYHHEHYDGSGYPCRLMGEEIPLPVQILSIADVYDALTSERPYKRAFSHEEALEIMRPERSVFFSPRLFDIFIDNSDLMKDVLDGRRDPSTL